MLYKLLDDAVGNYYRNTLKGPVLLSSSNRCGERADQILQSV